MKLQDKFNFSS